MLTAEQVSINTMQVEIKSMMVGKKQLTLSLMRQIIEEPLIDEESILFRGMPWGHVNYFWGEDKHKTYPSYINIIWQKCNVLRRSIIQMELKQDNYHENGCHRIIDELKNQIIYYENLNQRDGFSNKIIELNIQLADQKEYLEHLIYRRNVFIPKYHQLVAPLKSLDHFYIAV